MSKFLPLVAAVALVAGGCGPAPHTLVEAGGTLMMGGKPLPNVLVLLAPESTPDGLTPLGASGTTDAQGRFTLVSDNGKPGAAVGTHHVMLIDNNLAEASTSDDEQEQRGTTATKPATPKPARKARFSTLYGQAGKSPLKVEIKAGQKDYPLKVE